MNAQMNLEIMTLSALLGAGIATLIVTMLHRQAKERSSKATPANPLFEDLVLPKESARQRTTENSSRMKIPITAIFALWLGAGGSIRLLLAEDAIPAKAALPIKQNVSPAKESLPRNVDGRTKAAKEKIIKIVAKDFEFIPRKIKLRKGKPVVLEITAKDSGHSFLVTGISMKDGTPLRATLTKGTTTSIRIVPNKAGKFRFRCDNVCGLGHKKMGGMIIVETGKGSPGSTKRRNHGSNISHR